MHVHGTPGKLRDYGIFYDLKREYPTCPHGGPVLNHVWCILKGRKWMGT